MLHHVLLLTPALLAGLQSPSASDRAPVPGAGGQEPPRVGRIDLTQERVEWEEDEDRRDEMLRRQPDQATRRRLLEANGLLLEPGSSLGPPTAESGGWERIGPHGALDSIGGNGRLEDIQFAASEDEIEVFVAGPAGVWRMRHSTWGQWEDLSAGLPRYGVGAIDVDPSDSRRVIAATGCREDSGQGIFVRAPEASNPSGPWGWTPAAMGDWDGDGNSDVPQKVWRIARSSADDLVAATSAGLLRSTDNGDSWVRVKAPSGGAGGFSDVIADPSNPTTLWACEYIPNATVDGVAVAGEIWRYDPDFDEDDGDDDEEGWQRIGDPVLYAGIANPDGYVDLRWWQRAKLAVCRTQPDVIAVLAANPNGWAAAYRCEDARAPLTEESSPTWTNISGTGGNSDFPGFWTLGGSPDNNMCLAIHPDDPDELHAGMVWYWQRSSGGIWQKKGDGKSVGGHADFTALRFTPAYMSNALFALNDGGAYWVDLTTNDTFSMAGDGVTGICAGQLYTVTADREKIWVTLQDNGVVGSEDGGATWFQTESGDGGAVEFTDSIQNETVYSGGIYDGKWKRLARRGSGSPEELGEGSVGWWPWPSHHHPSNRLLFSVDKGDPMGVWDTSDFPPSYVEGVGGLHADLTCGSPYLLTPGAGYTAGDILEATGGVPRLASKAFQIQVLSVSSDGRINTWKVRDWGLYITAPDNPFSFSGGTGSGATFSVAWVQTWSLPRPWVSPFGPQLTSYVTFKPGTTQQRDLVRLTRNADGDWSRIVYRDLAPAGEYIGRVTPSQMWPGEAWLSLGANEVGRVLHTSDYAASPPQDISGNLSSLVSKVNDVAAVPFAPQRLYAATDMGVYSTLDGGGTWTRELSVPPVNVQDLHLDLAHDGTGSGSLYAATYCQGVYRKPLSSGTVVFVDPATPSVFQDGSFEYPFADLSAGLAAAPDGSTVAVRSGTYAPPVFTDRAVLVVSWAGGVTIH
jgi:hypothetical protein